MPMTMESIKAPRCAGILGARTGGLPADAPCATLAPAPAP
jgi:hypothetical protein